VQEGAVAQALRGDINETVLARRGLRQPSRRLGRFERAVDERRARIDGRRQPV
jgi:hypothetical protein